MTINNLKVHSLYKLLSPTLQFVIWRDNNKKGRDIESKEARKYGRQLKKCSILTADSYDSVPLKEEKSASANINHDYLLVYEPRLNWYCLNWINKKRSFKTRQRTRRNVLRVLCLRNGYFKQIISFLCTQIIVDIADTKTIN